jgi:hypothetical protein
MGDLFVEVVRLGLLLTALTFGLWVAGASVAAWVGWEKGRDPIAWFVLAFFLSPLVALIALVAVPTRRVARTARRESRPTAEDPAVAAARLVNAIRQDTRWTEGARWDVATSAATSTRRPW